MAGSADVAPQEAQPNVMHAKLTQNLIGRAGQLVLAYTHNGVEGVAEQVAKDLQEAIAAVMKKHGFDL
jgi:uncharacterized protein YfdQ (DUF2303 family)